MARKNLLTGLTNKKLPAVNSNEEGAARTPALAFTGRGAFGAVTRTIDDLAARADAARTLEARLTTGELILDLDPALIDRSFITDRMEGDDESFQALRASIAAKGQDSPILVRPHPTSAGRYQVAFGHRRLRAAAELGRAVRAIIKPLSDQELVIAQGQENSARADLSFIERGRFAQALEEGGYDRETIMQALSIDKTALSRLISVVNRLPTDIVEAIGPAPSAGRDRWLDLATSFSKRAVERPVDPLLESEDFLSIPSDQRFDMLHQHLTRSEPKVSASLSPSKPRPWLAKTGETVATVTVSDKAFVLKIDQAVARGFGEFLLAKMGPLYEEYMAGPQKKAEFRYSSQR
jgi:ParB family chromosome partitioning protein